MTIARFPVDFSFYGEAAVDSAISDFSEIATFSKEEGVLAIETPEGGQEPEVVFDELMNYVLQTEVVSQ